MNSGSAAIEVLPVTSKRDLDRFIRLPYRIYEGDPYWVAPLVMDVRKAFDPSKHPFYQHSDVQPYLATRDGEVVGRIAAIHNRNHVEFHEEPVGFFGWFECIDDQAVADAMFKAAADWPRLPELRERAEALMGFAGASSALGMHYGSTGDSNRKMVQMLAGGGEFVPLPGAGHLLTEAAGELRDRLGAWIPEKFAEHEAAGLPDLGPQ